MDCLYSNISWIDLIRVVILVIPFGIVVFPNWYLDSLCCKGLTERRALAHAWELLGREYCKRIAKIGRHDGSATRVNLGTSAVLGGRISAPNIDKGKSKTAVMLDGFSFSLSFFLSFG